ncbi:MAG: type III-B CRISPR module RAMP protein Cmr4 [Deltaproteobacteria bacterium]|nr:MAG: type III-B CRISPR module RAMP protein Cmr4 [Deltaproteobacteria bacterium]
MEIQTPKKRLKSSGIAHFAKTSRTPWMDLAASWLATGNRSQRQKNNIYRAIKEAGMGDTIMGKRLFIIRAMSNIHCGVGQEVADIDLPTAREAMTGFPIVPGSTIKGVLRDYFNNYIEDKEGLLAAFGPEFANQAGNEHASALMLTDARILALPVRSFAGVFAYVTAPLVLERLRRDLIQVPLREDLTEIPEVETENALVLSESENMVGVKILLEDLDLNANRVNGSWQKWVNFLTGANFFDGAWGTKIARPRFTLVSNDVFSFLCDTALPVAARIKLDEKTGTVKRGGLWYEESLPAETILCGLVVATKSYRKGKDMTAEDILSTFATQELTLQLGGNATTGKGICSISFMPAENSHGENI